MWGRDSLCWKLLQSYTKAARYFSHREIPMPLTNDSQYEKSWRWIRDTHWWIKAVCINTKRHSRNSFRHIGLQQPVPLPGTWPHVHIQRGTEMHGPSKQRSAPKQAGFALPVLYLKELRQPSSRTATFLMNSVLDWRALGRSCQKVQESLLRLPKGKTEI